MPRFNFRLQQYLGVKEQIENQKELEYSHAIRKLEEEKALLVQMLEQREAQITAFQQALRTNIDPIEIRRFNGSIDRLKYQIFKQQERVNTAEVYVETKREELVVAMKERKALEIVKDNAREEFNLEANLAEQRQVDELVSFRYTDKQKN